MAKLPTVHGAAARGQKPLQVMEVARYLVDRELVSQLDVVDGNIRIVDQSRRNRNYIVYVVNNQSWFVKQGIITETRQAVAHEAAVCKLLEHCDDSVLRTATIGKSNFDEAADILVYPLLHDAYSSNEYHRRLGRYPKSFARSLARTLAALHRLPAADHIEWHQFGKHWIFDFHTPHIEYLTEASRANLALLEVLQNDELISNGLAELSESWVATSLVHNDIKWENILVALTPQGRRNLKLIDWELTDIGDPAWDIGSTFAAYLLDWLKVVPVASVGEQFAPPTPQPRALDKMHAAQSTFWAEYAAAAGLDTGARMALLRRSMQMAAARLILYSVEMGQHSSQLYAKVVLALQLASNIFDRPLDAASRLCGIHL